MLNRNPQRRVIHGLLWIALLTLGAPSAATEDESFPIDGAMTVDLAPDLHVNGTRTRIRTFTVHQPVEEALRQSRTWLGAERIERDLAGWHVLAGKRGRSLTTLRLRADGAHRTVGTLSESSLARSPVSSRTLSRLALPAGSTVVSDVRADDIGKQSQLLMLFNGHPMSANVRHFSEVLAALGFQLQHHFASHPGGPHGHSLWFSGDDREALMIAAEIPAAGAISARTQISLSLVRYSSRGRAE